MKLWKNLKALWSQDDKALDQRFTAIETGMGALQQENTQLKEEKENLEGELAIFRQQEEDKKGRYESMEPWIEIVSEDFDEKRGFRISLDWNDAFIRYLKANGINGTNDEEIVRKYLAFLYDDLLVKFEQKIADEKESKPKISDYE